MNIYNNEQEQKFLELRVQGKSLKSISKELDIPTDILLDWDFELAEDVHDAQSIEYDKIVEEYELTHVNRFKYLAELYGRLKKELDKRDFSGLPTDKLYIILSTVYEQIQNQLKSNEPNDWYDDDDFDPLLDMPEDLK